MHQLRHAIEAAIEKRMGRIPSNTTAYRLVNDVGDQLPGMVVDRLGDYLLIQSAAEPKDEAINCLNHHFPTLGIYYKCTTPHLREKAKEDIGARHVLSPKAPLLFPVLENGLHFLLSLDEGYSYGLFLDQRENRRHILEMNLSGKALLNTFAYTCAFSVCSARAGATVTSLDLSKSHLERGRENFRENHLDDAHHDFIFGDVFDWLPRLARKHRKWDVIILDPPTFSSSKTTGLFKVEQDYPKLLKLARACLAPGGRILACMNTHNNSDDQFKKLTGISELLPSGIDFPHGHLRSGWII